MNPHLKYYIFLVILVALQRMGEVVLSRKNEKTLKDQGAIEVGHAHFIYMKVLHTLWPIACVVEALIRKTSPSIFWMATFALVFLVGQLLRIMAIATLGKRWSVKILILPGTPPVTKGIFKYIRHPNYLGVILELFALPLIFGGWISALLFSLLNAWLLSVRIKREEQALHEGNRYKDYFADRNRFIPKGHSNGQL